MPNHELFDFLRQSTRQFSCFSAELRAVERSHLMTHGETCIGQTSRSARQLDHSEARSTL